MLIDRDAALTAVDMDTSMVLPGGSKPGSVAWRMRDAALNAIRALPAIGTCADCAEWRDWHIQNPNSRWCNYGSCCTQRLYFAEGATDIGTPSTHSCAAWRAKP